MSKVLIVRNEDKRMKYIKEYLEKVIDITEITDELQLYYNLHNKDFNYLILPLRGINKNQVIDGTTINLTDNYLRMAREKTIYTGLIDKDFAEKCSENKIRLVTYLAEDIAIKNNYLTTEGIIEAIVNNSEKGIYCSKILIIGYGKLGIVLANILKSFKAKITISCRNEKDLLHAKINDFNVLSLTKLISYINQFDFIINTVPYPIIDHTIIKKINNPDLLIIDVSSKPYGLDHDFAKSCSLNTLLLPGIPGKKAPKTAGELIGEFIYQDICGGEVVG